MPRVTRNINGESLPVTLLHYLQSSSFLHNSRYQSVLRRRGTALEGLQILVDDFAVLLLQMPLLQLLPSVAAAVVLRRGRASYMVKI